MSEKEPIYLDDLKRVRLEVGDTLVLMTERRLTQSEAETLNTAMKSKFPQHKCILLTDGIKLGVLEADA